MKPEAYEIMAKTEEKHWWFVGRRRIIASVLAAQRLAPSASILEIGAGTGGNLAMLSQFGKINALERDDFARKTALDKTGVAVQAGALPDELPYSEAAFDLICLFDVLEHIEDDGKALLALKPLLKPGGKVILTVPAYPWMWSYHDVQLHHFRRYTRQSLSSVCGNAGFDIKRISYFNAFLFPLAFAVRLLDRLNAKTVSSGEEIPRFPINSLLRWIFSIEPAFLRYFDLPFGLSLLTVVSLPPSEGHP